jgi:flavin-dependent dehydrogenase
MGDERFDAIVIGGGPAGATLGALLARRGLNVGLFEKERFPRFHIGESLLPCSMPLFRELGILQELERRFLPKYAAEFVTADGSVQRRYSFAGGLVSGFESAFEVDRAEFDRILLDNALRAGASVREGFQVTSFDLEDSGVTVATRGPDGAESRASAELLIDASGQSSLLAGRLGMRRMDPTLRNFSVFSHFEGAERYSGNREGDISVVLAPEGWWWVIPLAGDRTSVGYVAPARALSGRKPDETYFFERIAATPYLATRLARARRTAPVRTLSDWSYSAKRLVGDRWLLVGDAGAFVDPVFSTGVYLGMIGAFRAAETIERAFLRGDFRRRQFVAYERWVRRSVARYRDFVRGFYHPAFVEVLLHPSDWMGLRAAVTSLLAGHGVDRFDVNWRVLLFRSVARLNRTLQLVPRLPGRREGFAGLR